MQTQRADFSAVLFLHVRDSRVRNFLNLKQRTGVFAFSQKSIFSMLKQLCAQALNFCEILRMIVRRVERGGHLGDGLGSP